MNGCASYTNASQAAVVKVDIKTGHVQLLEYLIVHDCGTVINPVIVQGQVSGGIAQGIGGALFEQFHYDEDGNPQSTSFLDYHIPSTAEVPPLRIEQIETPSPVLPWGAKGVGEAGIVGPAPAIAAAVEDALFEFGVGEITDTPITPPVVFGLLKNAVHSPVA
jgi:carbon-monoxide dehydrogenase large subunit